MINARQLAVDILDNIQINKAYSNILLKNKLNTSALAEVDKRLVTELVYGTIQRQLSLDYIINSFLLKNKLTDLPSWLQQTIRSAVYQIVYLQRIPAHAVVNEAVTITKKKGNKGQSAMVNGILRNILRNLEKTKFDNLNISQIEMLSIKYSLPVWLIKKWKNELDKIDDKEFQTMLEYINKTPITSIRMNVLKINNEQFEKLLDINNFSWQKSPILNNVYYLNSAGNIFNSEIYNSGLFSVQDESSTMVANIINPSNNSIILDACAAPGGKTLHIAELQNDKGIIIANEMHQHKANQIQEQSKRLGINSVKINVSDILRYKTKQKFDYVLLDAPCSGLGVLRRKPEIRWRASEQDIKNLVKIQAAMLQYISSFVKVGGFLIYSTCTISKPENQLQIENFLNNNTNFNNVDIKALVPEKLVAASINSSMLQILPHHINSDGFFIAKMQKITEE